MFGNIGLPELLIILAIVLLLFGAKKLPDVGANLGRGIKSFRDAMRTEDASAKPSPDEKHEHPS